MAGEMHDTDSQLPQCKFLVVVKKTVKHPFILISWNAVFGSKSPLDLFNALADANGRPETLDLLESVLKVRRCCQVIGVCMCLEDFVHLISVM